MTFADRILARIHAFLQRADRRLGEPVIKRPPPPRCFGCDEPITGPGYRAFGELWCDVWCCPPVLDGERRIARGSR